MYRGWSNRGRCGIFGEGQDELAVFLRGQPEVALTRSLPQANKIFGQEVFAMVAAVSFLGEQLGTRSVISFLDNNTVSGALFEDPSRAPVVLGKIEGLRETAGWRGFRRRRIRQMRPVGIGRRFDFQWWQGPRLPSTGLASCARSSSGRVSPERNSPRGRASR